MLSHVNIGVDDLPRAAAFYDAVLAPLDAERIHSDAQVVGWRASAGGPALYVGRPFDGRGARPGNGAMVAFRAPDRATVDLIHAIALRHGGTCEGAPGPRSYRPGYYGAYFRDPGGNKLHIAHY